MIPLHTAWYDLRHRLRTWRMRRLFVHYRRTGQRAGLAPLDAYSDAALMVGMLALRRMEATGETYAEACAAVLPDVAANDLVALRDVAAIGVWLAG